MDNGRDYYWQFALWYRDKNRNKIRDNIFRGTGDMNVVAVSEGSTPEEDLLRIKSPQDKWDSKTYFDFYKKTSQFFRMSNWAKNKARVYC